MSRFYKTKLIPVILCGGSGSRLWPLSRKSYPKQFLKLEGNIELTLLQKTLKRLESFENISKVIQEKCIAIRRKLHSTMKLLEKQMF